MQAAAAETLVAQVTEEKEREKEKEKEKEEDGYDASLTARRTLRTADCTLRATCTT